MKRRIALFLLVALVLTSSVFAYTEEQVNTADAMNHLGLFLGTNLGYELDNQLTRAQGVTLLVRMIGKEAEAVSATYQIPFTDVVPWARGYIGYAWTNGITNGRSETMFDPDGVMTDYMFLTLTLRALGYSDSGENASFSWDNPYAKAQQVGLISRAVADAKFTRGDAVQVFWNAMEAQINGSTQTLSDSLIVQGVFTPEQYAEAAQIQANGREEHVGIPLVPGTSTPAVDPSTKPGESLEDGTTSDDTTDPDDTTKPEDTDNPEDKTDPEDSTKPEDTTDPDDTTEPEDNTNKDPDKEETPGSNSGNSSGNTGTADKAPEEYTYEEYLNMTGEEQMALMNRFDSPVDFAVWLQEAKAVYDEDQKKNQIEIGGDGNVDLSDLING